MLLIDTQIYTTSVFIFVAASLVHLAIIVFYIDEFRGLSGSHIQIALKQYKTGGIKGKAFAISLFFVIACFLFWIVASLTK